VEDATENCYGEEFVKKLGEHYGIGDSPIVSSDDLLCEWIDLRIYLILNCSKCTYNNGCPSLAC
jgi:hypothetical protein